PRESPSLLVCDGFATVGQWSLLLQTPSWSVSGQLARAGADRTRSSSAAPAVSPRSLFVLIGPPLVERSRVDGPASTPPRWPHHAVPGAGRRQEPPELRIADTVGAKQGMSRTSHDSKRTRVPPAASETIGLPASTVSKLRRTPRTARRRRCENDEDAIAP